MRYRGCLFEESGKREPQLEHAVVPSHGPDAAGVWRSCDDVRGDLTNEVLLGCTKDESNHLVDPPEERPS